MADPGKPVADEECREQPSPVERDQPDQAEDQAQSGAGGVDRARRRPPMLAQVIGPELGVGFPRLHRPNASPPRSPSAAPPRARGRSPPPTSGSARPRSRP